MYLCVFVRQCLSVSVCVFMCICASVPECATEPTLVVVPDSYLPQAAQAGVRGDVEDVQRVAGEGALAVQVAVPAAALAAVQADTHVGGGAWGGRGQNHATDASWNQLSPEESGPSLTLRRLDSEETRL